MKLSDLKANPKNPRRISDQKLEMLKKALAEFGDLSGIIYNRRTKRLAGGHQRIKVLPPSADVIIEKTFTEPTRTGTVAKGTIVIDGEGFVYREVDWDEDKEKAANIAANKHGGEFDLPLLSEMILELDHANFPLELTGFDDKELEDLMAPVHKVEGQCDEDEVPEHVVPKTTRGDIYLLGPHRLMCGDSTVITDVEKLMNGEKAELLLTDPPYGVSYTEKNEWLNSLGKPMACPKAIENDSKTPDQMNEFWFTALSNAHIALAEKCSYYICSPQGGDLMMMMMSIIRAGFQLKHMLIWVKNNHVLGRCDYNYKHEPILYGWKDNGTHEFYGNGRCKTSVWDFNKPLKNDLHPTMKPVELMEEAILNSAAKGAPVMDLFGGSGSTLIACEKTNRRCFMMELDPHYCDVIVARWEKYTGKQAKLLDQNSVNTAYHAAKDGVNTRGEQEASA